MVDESVYVSLSMDEQRKYRSELLLAQTEVLSLIKKIAVVEEIKKEKAEYRVKLAREISVVLDKLRKFEERMPDPKIPKSVLIKPIIEETLSTVEEKSERSVERDLRDDAIEKELLDIQRQLKLLNG
jgi:hypothetical protein